MESLPGYMKLTDLADSSSQYDDWTLIGAIAQRQKSAHRAPTERRQRLFESAIGAIRHEDF